MTLKQKIRNRQAGVIVSAELIFILTILVIGLVVGWAALRDSVVAELHDLAEAIGEANQTYSIDGISDLEGNTLAEGWLFQDENDNATTTGNAGSAGLAGDDTGVNFDLAPAAEDDP